MFYFRKIIFYCTLIFITQLCQYSYAKKEKPPRNIDDKEMPHNPMQNINQGLQNAGKYPSDKMAEISENWRGTLARGGANIVTGVVVAAAATATYYGVKKTGDLLKWCWPDTFENKEELFRRKRAVRNIEILDLEKKLSDSLARHAFEETNQMGIPCACAEDANKYAAVAGLKALEKIVEEFKEVRKSFISEKA